MPQTPAVLLKTLKTFGLSLPGTEPKSPWPGHDDVAVNNKTFAFMSLDGGVLSMSLKLPANGPEVLKLSYAAPTAYGLGKSGWVSLRFPPGEEVAVDRVKRWMLESYRAQAPKRLVKQLETEQPWTRMGELPDAPAAPRTTAAKKRPVV